MSDRIVLKWPMPAPDLERVMLPGPVVAVAWQHGNVTLWIDHPVEGRRVARRFTAIPTGTAFPAGARFVGSAVSDEFVFHVYEVQP